MRQEAVSALLQQEQQYTQQRAQDRAQVVAKFQQIEHQAQGFIYELQGARQKERQEREMMKAEGGKINKQRNKLNKEGNQLYIDMQIRHRNNGFVSQETQRFSWQLCSGFAHSTFHPSQGRR